MKLPCPQLIWALAAISCLFTYALSLHTTRSHNASPLNNVDRQRSAQPDPTEAQIHGIPLTGNVDASTDFSETAKPASHSAKHFGSAHPSVAGIEAACEAATVPEFLTLFADALSNGDSAVLNGLLQKLPNSPECVETLKEWLRSGNADIGARRYAAEALVRIGSPESVTTVIDQILAAERAGDSELANTLMSTFEAPTTHQAGKVLLDLLASAGRFAENLEPPSEKLRSAVRKAVLAAPDPEGIGDAAAQLYLSSQLSGRTEALVELFEGLSHPNMLSSLAAQAYQNGSAEIAVEFMDRLGDSEDPGTAKAMVRLAGEEPALLSTVAERVFNWSLRHRDQAQLGVFVEQLTDSTKSAAQRIAAAYGMAGMQDTAEVAKTLEKALAAENDANVKASLVALQKYLSGGQ